MLPVHVINPNSLVHVTASIQAAVLGTRALDRDCAFATLHAGPAGITTQAHADLAATLVAQYVAEHAEQAAAFVVACFSDPGVFAAREVTRRPVIGIGHAGLMHALSLGRRVGVIAIASSAVPRHWRYWRALQLDTHVVQERALDLSVGQSGDPAIALEKMVQVGRQLVVDDEADVLVLGCAGMAALRKPLQDAVGVPVVDPCQAAAFATAAQLGAL
ncbi:aspartate/glutamate racemase family protein [Variovorax sp. J31P207]|uniref:aspartate/glutamate racemase family protein n=1 Tax=Variovorax sp. J31P207 TaxID=3053510 RepID=UPI002574F20C|nr:aspartate/glutamate racemase family protein [Variovorax sp. J31P207]MDM0071576.1 aspartate/glutamate racemase family protein [Variovorax sp. J31P207]